MSAFQFWEVSKFYKMSKTITSGCETILSPGPTSLEAALHRGSAPIYTSQLNYLYTAYLRCPGATLAAHTACTNMRSMSLLLLRVTEGVPASHSQLNQVIFLPLGSLLANVHCP